MSESDELLGRFKDNFFTKNSTCVMSLYTAVNQKCFIPHKVAGDTWIHFLIQGLYIIEKPLDLTACLGKCLHLHKALKSP